MILSLRQGFLWLVMILPIAIGLAGPRGAAAEAKPELKNIVSGWP